METKIKYYNDIRWKERAIVGTDTGNFVMNRRRTDNTMSIEKEQKEKQCPT
jgi:hypothetical protein